MSNLDRSFLSATSRTQSQRDSKARCLKKLDNAMERLISILPNEMQLSCKRGRANGLKLVEEYITWVFLRCMCVCVYLTSYPKANYRRKQPTASRMQEIFN